jgi:RHS repeat-associated protein
MVALNEKSMPIRDAGGRTRPLANHLYQDMTLDAVTELYDEGFRNYSPTLGRWTSQDPLGYINGANTYQMEASRPAKLVATAGTEVTIKGSLGHGTITFKTGFNLEFSTSSWAAVRAAA